MLVASSVVAPPADPDFFSVPVLVPVRASPVPKERKKENTQPKRGIGEEDPGSTPARAGFWKDGQGHRWGSPAPDKGHGRLAARGARWNPNSTGGRLISV